MFPHGVPRSVRIPVFHRFYQTPVGPDRFLNQLRVGQCYKYRNSPLYHGNQLLYHLIPAADCKQPVQLHILSTMVPACKKLLFHFFRSFPQGLNFLIRSPGGCQSRDFRFQHHPHFTQVQRQLFLIPDKRKTQWIFHPSWVAADKCAAAPSDFQNIS